MIRPLFIFFIYVFSGLYIYSKNVVDEEFFVQPRIAFITAIYGPYEATCKKFPQQTISADFICFTNVESITENGWIIDRNPYHLTHPCLFDTTELINSIHNNKHTFNIAKYYKQNFQDIPRLKDYDVVVWLDGTIEIINSETAEWVVNKNKQFPIIGWEHEYRNGSLLIETVASHFDRYTSTFHFGQMQPYQDVDAQYQAYINDGYNDKDYWSSIRPERPCFGMWVTCFVAFDNKNPAVTEFLNFWYKQTLQYTTQDQIGFSYTVQKLNFIPYTLPDDKIQGRGHSLTDFYIKHDHGR